MKPISIRFGFNLEVRFIRTKLNNLYFILLLLNEFRLGFNVSFLLLSLSHPSV